MNTLVHGPEEMLPRIIDVKPIGNYLLRLSFSNGEQRIFDAEYLLELKPYAELSNVFDQVMVAFGTAVWPGGIDISPETLYLRSVPFEDALK